MQSASVRQKTRLSRDSHESCIRSLSEQGKLTEAICALDPPGTLISPDLYKCIIRCCTTAKALLQGLYVHGHMMLSQTHTSTTALQSSIVYMYVQCGSLGNARYVFDHMLKRDAFSWNVMISAYTRDGHPWEAFKLFQAMDLGSVRPDDITYVNILKTCKISGSLDMGHHVHDSLTKTISTAPYLSVQNSLLVMYAHYGKLADAYEVFQHMKTRDVVTWTLLIAGYAAHGYATAAVKYFLMMKNDGIHPDRVTFLSVLQACGSLHDLEMGRQVHGELTLYGLDAEPFVASALVDLYSRCGNVTEARKMFDVTGVHELVSYNTMIAGYAKHRHIEDAFKCYTKLLKEGIEPDIVTFVNIMTACSSLANLEVCQQIHMQIVIDDFDTDEQIMNSILDMYAKAGSLADCHHIFDRYSKRDVVSWTAMIIGYAKQGSHEEAFELLETMRSDGVNPDKYTFVGILKACTGLTALDLGRTVHDRMVTYGLEIDTIMESALVHMYSRSGNLLDAQYIFDSIDDHDVVSWTTMIVAYAQHGYGENALAVMYSMLDAGFKLNHVTLTGVLSACSHSGLVREGQHLLDIMKHRVTVVKTTEHYSCMVDLLTRAGCVEEAERLLLELPYEPSVSMWLALLRSCVMYQNVNIATRAVEHVLRLDPDNDAVFVLLSNVYAGISGPDE